METKKEQIQWLNNNSEECQDKYWLVEESKIVKLESFENKSGVRSLDLTKTGIILSMYFKITWPEYRSNGKGCVMIMDKIIL